MSFPTQIGLSILLAAALFTICSTVLGMYVILVQIELQHTLGFMADEEAEHEVHLKETTSNEDDLSATLSITTTSNGGSSSGGSKTSSNNKEMESQQQPRQVKAPQPPTPSLEDEGRVGRRLYLPRHRRGALAAIVITITFMSYLLLARSNANAVLNWLGMMTVLGLLLHTTVMEELSRDRFERLATLLSMVLMLAMALNLAVYANQQHAQGDLYQGKARIISYDTSLYTQDTTKDTTLRTDLQVAWGGTWGCPNQVNRYCEAPVAGALCETDDQAAVLDEQVVEQEEKQEDLDRVGNSTDYSNNENTNAVEEGNNRILRKRRQLVQYDSRREISRDNGAHRKLQPFSHRRSSLSSSSSSLGGHRIIKEGEEQGKNGTETTEQSGNENDAAVKEKGEEDPQEKNQELKNENEQLKQKNEELEKEKAELENELEEYEENTDYESEEAEALDEVIEQQYSFDDDMYTDAYWGATSWDDVWGEFACQDLFDGDLSGLSVNYEEPPGSDDWPFINIYGNCNTCEAYVIDYFSTEHFQSILAYKNAAMNYGILAGLSLVITTFLLIRELHRPSHGTAADKEIELLPTAINGGALA
ncbi:hypothetical protein ACA910_018234 [Epithemia clementina (nom. ined.)]